MIKITNLKLLGENFTIADHKGNTLGTIQIVNQNEILDSALGKFDDGSRSFSSYLKSSIICLSGFANHPMDIYWHSCKISEYDFVQVVEYAHENGYSKVIVEFTDS